MDFPIAKMYGKKFKKGVEWIQTETCEEFGQDYLRQVNKLEKGEFLLYVIDSIDALVSEASKKRIDKMSNDEEAKKAAYAEKARYFSNDFFNHLCSRMKNKYATLIAISQVRQKIGVTFGKKLYRTGGKALDFYTHQVAWLYEKAKLKKTSRGEERWRW